MKSIIYTFGHAIFFLFGWLYYYATGKNTIRAHAAMVYFFCLTGGGFNAWVSRLISWRRKSLKISTQSGILGDMSGDLGRAALLQLAEKGYFVVERALSNEVCDRLMAFSLNTPATIRPMDGERKSSVLKETLYEQGKAIAIRYDYSASALLANADVQSLIADHSLLTLADMYLDARPKLDVLSMWWHTNFHDQPDSEAAQFYHFDLDRFKWLKVFIYLTDVGPHDGAHSFIEGSHVSGGIPRNFLERGYVRLSDDDVLTQYGTEREIQFTAPRGTVIVEDTRGLHKGRAVSGNPRLVLQLQLSNSLFGAVYPKEKMIGPYSSSLDEMLKDNSDLYRAYL